MSHLFIISTKSEEIGGYFEVEEGLASLLLFSFYVQLLKTSLFLSTSILQHTFSKKLNKLFPNGHLALFFISNEEDLALMMKKTPLVPNLETK